MFLSLLRNELLKLFARKRTYVGFAAYVVIEVIILSLLSLPAAQRKFEDLLTKNGIAFDAAFTGLTLATYMIFVTLSVLGGLYLALVSADLVAKEVEDGTMRMVLARPISRVRMLAAKAFVSIVHTFVFILFIGATCLATASLYRGGLGNLLVFAPTHGVFAFYETGEAVWRYVRALLFLGLASQMISALGLMFSCFKVKPATATILTVSVLMADLMLSNVPFFRAYESFFLTHHLGCWVLTFQYVVPWTRVAESLLYLNALTLSFWILGAMYFCDRDLKA